MVKKLLKKFIIKNILSYVIGFAALVTANFVAVYIPRILGMITDGLDKRNLEIGEIYNLSIRMLLFGVALFVLKFTFRYMLIGKSRDMECYLRDSLFTKLQSLSPSFYNEKKTGELMAYAINDLGAIRMAFAMGITFVVEGFMINAASIYVMAKSINPVLTLASLAPLLISVFVILSLRKKIRKKYSVVQAAFADLSDKVQENISGIRVVKAYNQEEAEINKLEKASYNRLDVQMKYVRTSALLSPFTQICFGVSFSVALVLGAYYVRTDVITLGEFTAFNTYLGMLIGPVLSLGRIIELWQRAFASMKRIDDILIVKPEVIDTDTMDIDHLKGSITIKNLKYKYPMTNNYVLNDISFHLQRGKTLGIIGKTGSGKTTLVNLILRLYKIKDGGISIDGNDINRIPLSVLRNNIGYVPQDNFLFATSINMNVKFFDQYIKDEAVVDSTKLACIFENIMGFPKNYETIIGERGITLSGGQKQRISIARALVKDPALLILDDSLSAVDANTEAEILMNINKILTNRTGILIAHRISTIKNCDEIIYLDEGRIVERGTHNELLEKNGEYARLNRIQALEGSFDSDEKSEESI